MKGSCVLIWLTMYVVYTWASSECETDYRPSVRLLSEKERIPKERYNYHYNGYMIRMALPPPQEANGIFEGTLYTKLEYHGRTFQISCYDHFYLRWHKLILDGVAFDLDAITLVEPNR